jgi:hypothetical protein
MIINELLNLTTPLANGSNQFTIQLANMNTKDGKQYYDNLINLHVQKNYGIYAICNSDNHQILYIGKGGTIQNDGTFKNQNLHGRLKAPRGTYNNSYLYFQNVMTENTFDSLIFLVIYSNLNNPPAYIESISLRHYLNQNNCLPILNNEF